MNETLKDDGHHIRFFYGTITNIIIAILKITSSMHAFIFQSIDKTDHSVFLLKVT